jgi:hypothetical protein
LDPASEAVKLSVNGSPVDLAVDKGYATIRRDWRYGDKIQLDLPMPVRHGLTIGELVRLFNGEARIGADLTVVPMKNWRRDDWFDDTGLAWVNPSPNMRNMVAATVYPGIGAIEGTNISVGRGTDTPFEQIGAPWIDGRALAAALNASALPGVRFYPVTFTPSADAKLGGQKCQGVFLIVTDRDRLRPVRVGLQIASTLARLYGAQFKLEDAATLFAPRAMLEKIRAGVDPAVIAAYLGHATSRTTDICDAHVVICARRNAEPIVTSDPEDLERLPVEFRGANVILLLETGSADGVQRVRLIRPLASRPSQIEAPLGFHQGQITIPPLIVDVGEHQEREKAGAG